MNICPNCSSELQKKNKKLGKAYNWLVCEDCGYRESDESSTVNEILDMFVDDGGSNFAEVVVEFNLPIIIRDTQF